MGSISRLILYMVLVLGLASPAFGVSKVTTTTVSSGQIPTAANWNTYLNYAENWINTNLLGGGTTFTIANGESLLVNGTLVVDSFRVTGFFDLAIHILPRATRTYRIGLPTRLLWALHADTVRAAIADFDSLLGTTIFGSTPIGRPSTDRTGVLGLPTFMWQSLHVDSIVGQNVTLDSLSVTSGIDSVSIDNGGVSNANLRADAVDSIKTRNGSISGSDLAGTLSGNKIWTGTQTNLSTLSVADGNASTPSLTSTGDTNTGIYLPGSDSVVVTSAGKKVSTVWYNAAGVTLNQYLSAPLTTEDVILRITVPASSSAGGVDVNFAEGDGTGSANNMGYQFGYDPSNNRFRLFSQDIDGASGNANVIQIPDGQLTIDGNSTFDDNAFDYVCEICGYHTLTAGECPQGHGGLVWHDDVEALREAVRYFKKNSNFVTSLEKLGVLKSYPNGEKFISMNKAPWVAFSAIIQQSDRITRENEALNARIDALKFEQVYFLAWAFLAGMAITLFMWRIK